MGATEERLARCRQFCPSCGCAAVKHVTTTTMVIYLRCEACAEIWSIPERRTILRTDPGEDTRSPSPSARAAQDKRLG